MSLLELKIENSGKKKYFQVADIVEDMIRKKLFEPGSRLPGDRKLAEMLKVTPVTVNKGLNELAARGIITRNVGAGSYVSGSGGRSTNFRIGIFIHVQPIMGDWYISNVINHFNDFWKKTSSEVIMQIKTPPEYRKAIEENKLDGAMVLAPEEGFIPYISKLREEGFPIVSIGCFTDKLPGVSFGTNHAKTAERAVEYLNGLAHKKIGVIMPGTYQAWPISQRLNGYNAGMWTAGLPVNPEWIVKVKNEDSFYDILRKKQERKAMPDALLLFANFSLQLYTALQNLELRISKDISVIGFDDTPETFNLPIPITVFAQPIDKIVYGAADSLYNMIKGIKSKYRGEFEPELIIRSSCAPFPKTRNEQ